MSLLFPLCLDARGLKDEEETSSLLFREILSEDSAIVQMDSSRLLFPAGHDRFNTLYGKLLALSSDTPGSVRVLHIGGSHVQAGTLSGRMRSNLQVFMPSRTVGRGMMFPFSVLGTNGPRDCSYSSMGKWERSKNVDRSPAQTLGLSGAALTTSDLGAQITFTSPSPFESILVYGRSLVDTAMVYPILVADQDTIYPPRSSEEQGYEFLLPRPVSSCSLALMGDSCGSFSLRGFVPDPYAEGLTYTESGINGAAVPSWLRCEAFEEELQPLAPDLVLFAIGINDANVQNFSPEQFKRNYRELIARILRCNPQCAFLFITNNDCYLRVGRRRTYNKNTALVQRAFMELAEEYQGAVFDLYSVMGGYGSSNKWVRAGLMQSDHIHFTARGYNLVGDLLFNALLDDYLRSTAPPSS